MRFQLRDYQKAAIHSVIQCRKEGYRRLLVCLPTGAGKTVIFSELCRLAKRNVLVLAHREELLEQAKEKIERMTEGKAIVSIEQGNRNATKESNVVVASIRSLRSERLGRLRKEKDFGLVIYDECHHAAAEDNMRVLRELRCFDGDWDGTLLGFTATTTRADGIGLGEVFELIAYERNILDMIREKYLVPLRGYRINTAIDLQNILSESSEELSEAIDIESRNALVARSIQELARDRRTIVFCVSVTHALNLCKSLNALGIPTGVVYGAMPRDKRSETLKRFRQEKLSVLTNVGVLTEGFDDPGVSCIAMARPTKSESLYAQCIGRGARLAPNKTDCIVLDFVDLSDLSLINLPSLLGLPKELNLQGEEVAEAVDLYQQLRFDFPGFELEATEITLQEIKTRAESFDPLTMELHPDVVAITPNGWFSLGKKGLGLYFFRKNGRLSKAEILNRGKRKKERYHILIDNQRVAAFSKILDAVEAVDYEIEQMGRTESNTAHDEAQWRQEPPPIEIQRALQNLTPPRSANNLSDALGYLCYASHHDQKIPRPERGRGWPPSLSKDSTT
ncbi:MAG: DEAD/DEAH box helicase family protein [Myxococcota bacterium]|nr:DEAD/DEAH box helicase family protein [Myxococcota bacterium]